MSNDTPMNALYLALLLILPVSALAARRIPLKQTAKMALAWIGIFAIGFVIVGNRHRVTDLWARISDTIGGSDQSVVGDQVRIQMADDGHFWAWVDLNGVKRRMLIDSGATTTAISAGTAKAAGLDLEQSPFAIVLDTANGKVAAQRSSVASLTIGTITFRDLPVVVSKSFGETDVIGMNFLSRLAAWRVERGVLILQPKAGIT